MLLLLLQGRARSKPVQPLLRPLEKFWAEFSGTERPSAMRKQSGAAGSHTDAKEKQRVLSLNFRRLPAKAKPDSAALRQNRSELRAALRNSRTERPEGISEIKRARTQRAAREGTYRAGKGDRSRRAARDPGHAPSARTAASPFLVRKGSEKNPEPKEEPPPTAARPRPGPHRRAERTRRPAAAGPTLSDRAAPPAVRTRSRAPAEQPRRNPAAPAAPDASSGAGSAELQARGGIGASCPPTRAAAAVPGAARRAEPGGAALREGRRVRSFGKNLVRWLGSSARTQRFASASVHETGRRFIEPRAR